MKKAAALLALLLLAASCAFAQECEEESSAFDVWATNALGAFGESMEKVVRELGEPVRRELEKTANRHNPNATDIMETLFYDGLKIGTLRSEDDSWFFVVSAETSSSAYEIGGLKTGDASGAVTKILGKPHSVSESKMVYESDFYEGLFGLEDGKVTQIQLLLWLD